MSTLSDERDAAVKVAIRAWGVTDADVDKAIRQAGIGPSRAHWVFVQTERLTDPRCPLDLLDGAAVATDKGHGWAYAVYPARR